MTLKGRLRTGELTIGAFVKTPSPIVVEVLSLTGLDCLCLDAEHAPFDRLAVDGCVMAARAAGKDVLVRPPSAGAEHVLSALDSGAAGVLLPHIRSAREAEAAALAAHYGPGGRGYAGSTRAAGYATKPMAAHMADSAAQTVVIAQIEDVEALACLDDIASVKGLDALFVGRVDLTVSLGAREQDDPRVIAAVEAICAAAARHGRAVGMFLSRPADVRQWRAKGASLFLLGSDHGFILAGAAELLRQAQS